LQSSKESFRGSHGAKNLQRLHFFHVVCWWFQAGFKVIHGCFSKKNPMSTSEPQRPGNKTSDEDEACGVARTPFDDQFAAARKRGVKKLVRRPSMETAPSVRDMMGAFQQKADFSETTNALGIGQRDEYARSMSFVHPKTSSSVGGNRRSTWTSRSAVSDRNITSATTASNQELPLGNSVPERQTCVTPLEVKEDCDDLAASTVPDVTHEDVICEIALPEKKNEKMERTSAIRSKSLAQSSAATSLLNSSRSTLARHKIDSDKKTRSRSLLEHASSGISKDMLYPKKDVASEELCGVARTAYDDQFTAARKRGMKKAVRRPSMEGAGSVRDMMGAFNNK
jgi:hypothetical protein